MVGRSAERDRQLERAKAWVDEVEQACVFQREKTRKPRVAGVANGEPRLEAVQVAIRRETGGGEAKLSAVGDVLGVVDDQEVAARLSQSHIERSRLGRRRPRRRDDDLVAWRQIECE